MTDPYVMLLGGYETSNRCSQVWGSGGRRLGREGGREGGGGR